MPLFSPALRYFEQVARHGSIQETARRLNVAASAVNRQILKLEEEFGTPLFERNTRGMRLTVAGQTLVLEARKWLKDAERMHGEIDAVRGLRTGHVRIATMECFSRAFLPDYIAAFQRRHPRVTFDLKIVGTTTCVEMLVRDDVDAALAFNVPQRPELTSLASRDLPIVAAMRPDHPLASAETLRLIDCAPFEVVLPDDTLALSAIVRALISRMGERGPPVVTSNSIAAMKAMIVRSQLIGFMTHIDARPETDRGELQCVPVVDSRIPPDRLTIAVRRNRSSIPAVDSFLQDLLSNFENVGA